MAQPTIAGWRELVGCTLERVGVTATTVPFRFGTIELIVAAEYPIRQLPRRGGTTTCRACWGAIVDAELAGGILLLTFDDGVTLRVFREADFEFYVATRAGGALCGNPR